ncbi:replication protein A 70 kDa DNA-binding subunit B-like isoform X2 [Solanum tuberosum]|uniref:replication protein A 70 kDa DNA-binding subunit B-like isoform X2 n=1 Tax=Solanum tuberosum TaxID=4113 RepID=UPI00073A1D4D|nr:PREDICTED: replication protein A 70 kDa DNA-binding subunit B-like isoform X2 [Solanum tuberosum]
MLKYQYCSSCHLLFLSFSTYVNMENFVGVHPSSKLTKLPPVISFFLYISEYAKLLWTSSIFQAMKATTIWLTIFPTNMVLRVNINQIEPATRDWICKVQIVEIARPRESLDKKCTFQNLILEDEEECQIKVVMYSDEIQQYAATLKLLNTYLISTAKVKVSPSSYGKPIHKFQWTLDKETVIEQIQASHEVEKPLPPPTRLNITNFDRIPHLMVDSAAEIDILAIVLRCGPQKTAGRSHHRCREITVCDDQRNQFLFTLWEDFGEIEGHQIFSKMATEADLLVILGRSIGISTYQGLSLQTRYNSTVRVNPDYPQAMALINWAKENKTMLLGSPSEKTSTSSSITPMIVTPAGQQFISIAEISSAPSMGVFYVEAEMAILDEFQDFCVLECSGCKQKKRTKDRKDFECPKCNRKTSLVPRCTFQIDLIDNTATTTASISAELGEKLLSMTAKDIFDITCTKRQSLSLTHVHDMLSNKVFEIQLRKSSWGSSNTTNATLSILSYMEKQHTPQSTSDRTPKKIKPLEISEVEVMATTATAGPSNALGKIEPPTPTKKV